MLQISYTKKQLKPVPKDGESPVLVMREMTILNPE